jgi:hypothetical protein
MRILQLMTWSAAALCVLLSVAHACSCPDDIDRMQARIDARVEAIAAAGPFVPPGISAGMGVQPAPFGMATVEEKREALVGHEVRFWPVASLNATQRYV